MTTSFSPADMAHRRPTGIGPVTEGHAPKIRAFAFFPYRGERGAVAQPDLAKVAWREALTILADMAEPNAFALPGGQIFVTRGMMELGLNDDALAARWHELATYWQAHPWLEPPEALRPLQPRPGVRWTGPAGPPAPPFHPGGIDADV